MFAYPNVRTVDQARRQIYIAERVVSMHEGNDYYWYHCGNGVFGVAKRSFSEKRDTAYTVTLFPLKCDCPNFQDHGDYCKHVIYLWEQLERASAEGLTDSPENLILCLQQEAEEFGRLALEADAIDGELRGSYGVEF